MQTFNVLAGRAAACVLLAFGSLTAVAQQEAGLLLSIEAEKKVDKQLSVGAEAGFRSRNNFRTADRASFGVAADYKLAKWLKAGAGYALLYDNNREDISYHANGYYNHWRPSYWGVRHRFNVALTGDYKLAKRWHLSLRERWQYTYRPEKTVERWDFDDEQWQDKVRRGKGKNQLRSRLQLSYDKKKAMLHPYASVELYNSWAVEKVRYTVGSDIKFSRQHSFDVFYRFQNRRRADSEDYDPDMHYLGLGYKFKF